MLVIDGRSGGGQLLRTALSLSALTGTPFEMESIRGNRPAPGLKPQHASAVTMMAELCGAEVVGGSVGSDELTFRPGLPRTDPIEIDIGTAGSVVLLFDTVLPLATGIDGPLEITVTGGTDVKWSPPFDFFRRVKLPLLDRFGLVAGTDRHRTGFYPAGGGLATLHLDPSTLRPLQLHDRGLLVGVEVYSTAADDLEERAVAHRQAEQAEARLDSEGVPVERAVVDYIPTHSIGSVLVLRAEYDQSAAGFDGLGERGKPAEAVADEVVERFLDFHRSPAAVDAHLGDQLLVFLALAGGRVRAPGMTDHLESNAAVIRDFGFDLRLDERDDGTVVAES